MRHEDDTAFIPYVGAAWLSPTGTTPATKLTATPPLARAT